MKRYFAAFLAIIFVKIFAGDPTTNNLAEAQQKAKAEHKLILLKFSGSDWCVPCINIQKKVIDTPEFQNFAKASLVMMDADFPRQKKNQLSAADQKTNQQLAEKYDKEGIFPKLVLLDENGKVLAHWEGLKKLDPAYLKSEILPYFANR